MNSSTAAKMATTTTNQEKNIEKTNDDDNDNDSRNNTVIFVHFHKAGGTSIINKFKEAQNRQKQQKYHFWEPNGNGNTPTTTNK